MSVLLADNEIPERRSISMDIFDRKRIPISNVLFDNVSMTEAVECILRMAHMTDTSRYVCTGNLDHLVILDRDPDFRSVYMGADLVLADGMPVVMLSKLSPRTADGPLKERVTGSDLFWELARISHESHLRLFFLGGVPGSALAAAEEALRRYPNAQICGTYCPPKEFFAHETEQRRMHAAIRAAQPDILLVGFGAPKQEKWIANNKNVLGVPVSIGVGGSFEMAGGMVERAPRWMQNAGLEWFFRFHKEPKRLFRRYFVNDLPFLVRLAWRAVFARKTLVITPTAAPVPAPLSRAGYMDLERP